MIYWDRLMGGLSAAITEALPGTPTVVWSPSEYPRDDVNDFIALRLISGPDIRDGRFESLGGMRPLPTTIRVTCTNTSNALGRIAATGAVWSLEVGNPETAEAYRDRWLDELATVGKSLDATITPVSTNAFDIVGTNLWSLYGFSASGETSASITASTNAIAKTADAVMQVEIQCFSHTRYAYGGAMDTATRLLSSLDLPAVYDIMNSRGLVILNRAPIIDLTTLSGPGWESRAALTINVGMRAFVAEQIDTIEEVISNSVVVKNESGTTESSITFTQGLP